MSGDNVEIAELAVLAINVVFAVRRHKPGGEAFHACGISGAQLAHELAAAGYEIEAIDVDNAATVNRQSNIRLPGSRPLTYPTCSPNISAQ